MLVIQILPPLLFRTDFPGYRTSISTRCSCFWVISNFFKCQKPHYSRHGLSVNSHANFTYSFPTLKIILIPTKTRCNHFWFISLIAHTAPPMPESQFLYLYVTLTYLWWGTHPKNFWLSWTILFGVCILLTESNRLLVGVYTLLAEIEHFLLL